MTNQSIHEELAIQYLLGSLSEEEMVRLDEMSVADDNFAELLDRVENDLVDQYVRGELSGDILEKFKTNYLSTPKRLEKLKLAQSFVQMIDKPALHERGKTLPFKSQRSSMQWVFAAAALFLLIAVGYLIFENYNLKNEVSHAKAEQSSLKMREQELQRELEQQRSLDSEKANELAQVRERLKQLEQQLAGNEVRLIAFNLAPPTRGISKIRQLTVPKEIESVAFNLELETNDYPIYLVSLKDPSTDEVLWRSDKLKADQKNIVKVILPAHILKTQNYILELSGISNKGASEVISNYPFQIIKE